MKKIRIERYSKDKKGVLSGVAHQITTTQCLVFGKLLENAAEKKMGQENNRTKMVS